MNKINKANSELIKIGMKVVAIEGEFAGEEGKVQHIYPGETTAWVVFKDRYSMTPVSFSDLRPRNKTQ